MLSTHFQGLVVVAFESNIADTKINKLDLHFTIDKWHLSLYYFNVVLINYHTETFKITKQIQTFNPATKMHQNAYIYWENRVWRTECSG